MQPVAVRWNGVLYFIYDYGYFFNRYVTGCVWKETSDG